MFAPSGDFPGGRTPFETAISKVTMNVLFKPGRSLFGADRCDKWRQELLVGQGLTNTEH